MGSKSSKSKKNNTAQAAETSALDATLFDFVITGSVAELQALLSSKQLASVDVRNVDLKTPLFYAWQRDAAVLLIEHGADVNARCKMNSTPLMHAAVCSHNQVIPILLDHGADVNAVGAFGQTPLFFVLGAESARILIERGADVNACDELGRSPLHHALNTGRLDVVTTLLDAGADTTRLDSAGRSVMHMVSPATSAEVMSKLLDRGAALASASATMETPLHAAASASAIDAARLLLDRGHPIDPSTSEKETPLYIAACLDRAEIVTLLLERCASVHGDASHEKLPLIGAALRGQLRAMMELVKHDAQLTVGGNSTQLGAAPKGVTRGSMVQLIIDNYAEITRYSVVGQLGTCATWIDRMAALCPETHDVNVACTSFVRRLRSVHSQIARNSIPHTSANVAKFAHTLLPLWRWMVKYADKSVGEWIVANASRYDDLARFHRALDGMESCFTLVEDSVALYKAWETSLRYDLSSFSTQADRKAAREHYGVYAFLASEIRDCGDDPDALWRRMHVVAIGLAGLHHDGHVHGALMSWSNDPYMTAPEVRQSKLPATCASDIYSFGRGILHGLTQGTPWRGVSTDVARMLSSAGQLPTQPEHTSDEQWRLIKAMCAIDPAKRPDISHVVAQLSAFAAL